MDRIEKIRKQFSAMAGLTDGQIDLVTAALIIARWEYPQLHEAVYLERLDELAATLKPRIPPEADTRHRIDALNTLLFSEEGFRGNDEAYHDPRNSFLNQVLYRKRGIPITLSLVYIAVGSRVGLDIQGVGLPGHFICVVNPTAERIFVDPYNGGKILSEDDCRKLAVSYRGQDAAHDPHLLEPLGPRPFICRMLRNLKSIYLNMNQELKAFQMIEWILTLDPDSIVELRERGLLYENMGNFKLAARDLERYLIMAPDAADAEGISEKISLYKNKQTLLH